MSLLQICVEAPAQIVQGLTSGAYERVGSVVRDSVTKKTVMWMRDAGGSVQELSSNPLAQAPQQAAGLIQGFGVSNEILAGLQVLNTAIMVAGFAMLAQKMSVISRQCDAILDRMTAVEQHLQWLRDAGIASMQAKMNAALEGAQTAHALGQSVLPYDTTINEAALFFRRMLEDMARKGNLMRDPEMFRILVIQHAVSVVARTRSQWLLLGAAEGLRALEQGQQAHAEIVTAFQQPLRTPMESAVIVNLSSGQRAGLKEIAMLLREVSLRFVDKREEMLGYIGAEVVTPVDADILRQLETTPGAWIILNQEALAVPVERSVS